MATSKRELSQKTNSAGKSEIIIRLSIGRGVQPRLRTGLFITPSRFKSGAIIKPRTNTEEAALLRQLEADLTAIELHLINFCADAPKEQLTKKYLDEQIDRFRHPERYKEEDAKTLGFFEAFDLYLKKHPLSPHRIMQYRVLYRALRRYELYTGKTGKSYKITLDGLTAKALEKFEAFLRVEHEIFELHPDIFQAVPSDTLKVRKSRKPLPKGNNTICSTFKGFRAFYNWCNAQGLTDNKPFAKYNGVKSEKYGTPYYLTIDERNHIANFDLSAHGALSAQRDIFIFQCLIGCRVSDLLRLTKSNIINGAVEYIATKTKGERPEVVRVPLHPQAATLVERYADGAGGYLFPFISPQRYNYAIKKIFTICGVTRSVTVLHPTTGIEEQRPLNEIAASHIARRTFVGNLYHKVKDPNLVGKLSGHKEGSKAFARYRDIDEEMKKEVINLL